MPLELGVWRIDNGLTSLSASGLDLEQRLEDILDHDITIANPGWMVIGRQIDTGFASRVDLLAIDAVGNLVLLELKRDQTPREVIAQVLEYGAWVVKLRAEDLLQIHKRYLERFHPERAAESLDQAYCRRFGVRELPEDLNQSHELVVVASQFDATSERIVDYLAEEHEVAINAIFFRVFKDGDREYLTRAWLRDPSEVDVESATVANGDWNGEFYVSYGGRNWEEARKYHFISGGGGRFYSKTLYMLEPGNRVWVNIPGTGYVGVGIVEEAVVPIDEFLVKDANGQNVPITAVPGLKITKKSPPVTDNPEKGEYLVRVKWLKTVDEAHAIKERGFFGNQNTVAKPRADTWRHTVERLKAGFGIAT